jgi:hypothetical protein
MAFNPVVAKRLTPYCAGLTRLPDYFVKVFSASVSLPFSEHRGVITAVHKWQHVHPPNRRGAFADMNPR